jgi:hypothetical protein
MRLTDASQHLTSSSRAKAPVRVLLQIYGRRVAGLVMSGRSGRALSQQARSDYAAILVGRLSTGGANTGPVIAEAINFLAVPGNTSCLDLLLQ